MAAKTGRERSVVWSNVHFLSRNPKKRAWEVLVLIYSPFWMMWALCILVPFKLYEHLNEAGYLLVGLAAAIPCIVLPAISEPRSERRKQVSQRFWIKANVWIAIFSFVGNYLWTHYFYRLLGARYTFPSWRLNNVPIPLYLMTHAYFCFYHALANMAIRGARSAVQHLHPWMPFVAEVGTVFVLSYLTALGETVTIAHFPHYAFEDRDRMMTVGSLFYAIYFFVSFPVFFRMDEPPRNKSISVLQCAGESLGATMLVTLLLDFWRIGLGPLNGKVSAARTGLPWL